MAVKENAKLLRKIEELEARVLTLEHSAAMEIAKEALTRACDALIKVGAIERSTHTIHPVPVNGPSSGIDLEKEFQKIVGLGKENFEQDLATHGFSSNDDSVEELV